MDRFDRTEAVKYERDYWAKLVVNEENDFNITANVVARSAVDIIDLV